MAQNITLLGASYSDVPAVTLPKTGGGTAKFTDVTPTTASASDVAQGKTFFDSSGTQRTGSASGGGGNEFLVTFTKSGNSWVPDKTFSQTFTAYTNGKTICSLASDYISTSIVYDDDLDGFYVIIEESFDEYDGSQYYNWGVDLYAYVWTSEGFDEDENSRYYATDLGTALPSDVASGKIFYNTTGIQVGAMTTGTAGTPTATKGTVSNHSVSITPSVTNTEGWISGGTKTGTAVSVSASELVSGNLPITQNGNNIDVTNYATVSVNVSGGSSKNAQAHESTTRATSSTYTNCNSLTCTKAGTYTVYWSCMRSSTSGTSGSQLYINGNAYGTADTTTWSNHVQNKMVEGVTIGANQSVAVYARSRGSNYYSYVPLITIIEE